jgi:creatinine amidohydrolase
MDAILAQHLCAAAARATGVPMLPLLPYGCSLGHSQRWAGTIALQPVTLITLVKEIGDWAYFSGVRRLFIVNTHVTNAAPLRCALEMLRAAYDDLLVALLNSGELSPRVRAAHFADGADWHANDAETSVALAQMPQIVRPDIMRSADDPDRTEGLVFTHPVNRTSTNGVTGAPSRASAAHGTTLFGWMVEDLVETIRRGLTETPPLAESYFP